MAQQLQDILAQLDPVYNPQKAIVNQQIAALPGEQQAARQGLDQAKTNAFGDIVNGANSRGMTYSGMPIAEQSKYLGTTYLPAVANLDNTYTNKGFQLQQSLAGLQADQMKQAQGTRDYQLKAEQDAQARVEAARLQAQAHVQAAQATASSRRQPNPAQGFGVSRDQEGGFAYHGSNGRPVSAAQYYSAIGGNIYDLAHDFQASGNQGDRAIAKDILSGVPQDQLIKKYPWVFQ